MHLQSSLSCESSFPQLLWGKIGDAGRLGWGKKVLEGLCVCIQSCKTHNQVEASVFRDLERGVFYRERGAGMYHSYPYAGNLAALKVLKNRKVLHHVCLIRSLVEMRSCI